MKYKIGDKVRVREDLEVYKLYGREAFTSEMVPLKGKIVTISKVVGYRCEIEEDLFKCWWTDEMFLPVVKYKIGDKVLIREDLEIDKEYGKDFFISEMNFLKGKTVTIINVVDYKYKIKEDSGKWSWTSEMFSGKVSEDFSSEESDSQSTLSKKESSSDIITVKTTKVKLLL